LLPEYKRIEEEIDRVIGARFGLPMPVPPEVKDADLRVLAAEQAQLLPAGADDWARSAAVDVAEIVVRHLPPELAKRLFLERFDQLR